MIPHDVKRVVVFHAGALGDLVNTLPSIVALRSLFGEARFTMVGNATFSGLFRDLGVIDEVRPLEAPGMHELFGEGPAKGPAAEFVLSFDLAVTWIRSPALLENLINLGLPTSAPRAEFPPPPGSRHATEYMSEPALALGARIADWRPRLEIGRAKIKGAPEFPGVIIHPGSGSERKNWPAERFAEAAAALKERTGLETALLEGPADRKAVQEVIAAGKGREAKVFRDLGALELAGLLSSARLVVGNDSGVCHLAGALGTPVVAVFGPTDPGVWGVRQDNAVNLSPHADCAPCPREVMLACKDEDCLKSVMTREVVFAGSRLLGA